MPEDSNEWHLQSNTAYTPKLAEIYPLLNDTEYNLEVSDS